VLVGDRVRVSGEEEKEEPVGAVPGLVDRKAVRRGQDDKEEGRGGGAGGQDQAGRRAGGAEAGPHLLRNGGARRPEDQQEGRCGREGRTSRPARASAPARGPGRMRGRRASPRPGRSHRPEPKIASAACGPSHGRPTHPHRSERLATVMHRIDPASATAKARPARSDRDAYRADEHDEAEPPRRSPRIRWRTRGPATPSTPRRRAPRGRGSRSPPPRWRLRARRGRAGPRRRSRGATGPGRRRRR